LRRRRYVAGGWLKALGPLLRYSHCRDAYVLRVVGRSVGPVLRPERRTGRRSRPLDGIERRRRARTA
jgi:hypothetical protein